MTKEPKARAPKASEYFARLLRPFPPGTRVRACLDIHYSCGVDVANGTPGTVVSAMPHMSCVFYVMWEGLGRPLVTLADALDPADQPP